MVFSEAFGQVMNALDGLPHFGRLQVAQELQCIEQRFSPLTGVVQLVIAVPGQFRGHPCLLVRAAQPRGNGLPAAVRKGPVRYGLASFPQ